MIEFWMDFSFIFLLQNGSMVKTLTWYLTWESVVFNTHGRGQQLTPVYFHPLLFQVSCQQKWVKQQWRWESNFGWWPEPMITTHSVVVVGGCRVAEKRGSGCQIFTGLTSRDNQPFTATGDDNNMYLKWGRRPEHPEHPACMFAESDQRPLSC